MPLNYYDKVIIELEKKHEEFNCVYGAYNLT